MARVTAIPKADRRVMLHDGRSLAYSEWGALRGRPVVLLHGMPSSRLLCPDEDATEAAGVRLITIDRAGYGGSDPRPDRTLLSWVEDYVELADLVDLPPCPIVGWSSGGPYALACALGVPDRVSSVGLAASAAPVDEVPGAWDQLPVEVRDLNELLRRDRAAATEGIRERCQWYVDGWEAMFDPGWATSKAGKKGEDPDDELLADPEILVAMKRAMQEGVRQGSAGYVADWIAEGLPWGFSVADVSQDVHVWWADADVHISRADTEYLAETIARSTLVTFPNEGHLFPVNHWADILTALF